MNFSFKGLTEKITIPQSYNIGTCFLVELWPLIEPKVLEEDKLTGTYTLFFLDICCYDEYCAEWNESVRRVTQIPKEQQLNLYISLAQAFECTLEFCKLYNNHYQDEIIYSIQLLESMKQDPKKHQIEWSLWKKSIKYVIDKADDDNFDWLAKPAWPYE